MQGFIMMIVCNLNARFYSLAAACIVCCVKGCDEFVMDL